MQKFKQKLLLRKISKLLDQPARPAEIYDSTMDTMYIGATAPRTAGHFADGAVTSRQAQVKCIAEDVGVLIDTYRQKGMDLSPPVSSDPAGNEGEEEEEDSDASAEVAQEDNSIESQTVRLEVRFQEVDLGILFTAEETEERRRAVRMSRREVRDERKQTRRNPSSTVLEELKRQVEDWQKEQTARKRKLYKIESTVRDLGVNLNDVRCRTLERERRAALVGLKAGTDEGIGLLKGVMEELDAMATG